VDKEFSMIDIANHDYEKHRDGIDSDYDVDEVEDAKLRMPKLGFNFLIIDCSPINFVDSVGVKTMNQVTSRLE
jgi:anti-anti-sigma regulatory factor